MKRFLACLTTAFALCAPVLPVGADEVDPSGRVRLSDDNTAPPPIPHVIGSDDTGRAIISGEPQLPAPSQAYMETYAAPNLGYQMGGDVFAVQYRLDQRNGGLWGYDDGYTNIGAFIPRAIDENSLLFWDLRGMVTNNSDGGFNLGFGRRHYDSAADRVYSQSIWLDYDGGHVKQYVQGGLSWAMTSRYWRTRVNANRLISDTNDFIGTSFDTNPFFGGNNVLIGRERVKEVAFNQLDASIGGPIPLLGQFGFNWDFGAYYNTSDDGQDGIGFMAHADANLTEDLLMDFRYTNDDIFGTSSQISFVFNLPDGRSRRHMRQPRVHDYMLRPEERNYRVSTKQYTIADSVPLLCPTDDSPIQVAHVDPFEIDNVLADGDGSFENPFNSSEAWNALSGAEKAQYHIVLVQPGATPDGTLIDNNLNSGFVIVENQRLLASTGQLVRDLDVNGSEVFRYAAHTMSANVAELGNGITFGLPGSEDFAGTIFDPLADPRPILTNDSAIVSNRPLSVVTIDNSFSVACDQLTEVSGFVINGQNPNMPTMLNNGIVTGNMVDPAMGTGVSGFNINSNFIVDTVHGVNITNFGDSTGILRMNRVEGDGFNSNSGMTVTQFDGALLMQVEDNVTYNIFGEDIDNDGTLDIVATGTEDVNGNGKLDIGEDLDGDGIIDLNEDNDKDGLLSSDDIGVGINLIANSAGAGIFAEDTTQGRHIIRNRTYQSEAEYYRQQSLNDSGEVENTFTAQDINGDKQVNGTIITDVSDTDDIVGNKNGINIEAIDGGVFSAYLADNDTSNNNPYLPGLLPTAKNPYMATTPAPLGNEFGLRTAATGANSVLTLASPDTHTSNNNFGHGYILEARNNATVTMLNPMMGGVTRDPVTGDVTATTPSQFNDNGLNGMLIHGDNNSSLALQIGSPSDDFDFTQADPADPDTRTYFTLNEFLRNGQDGDDTTNGNGIEIYLRSGATFAAGSNSGIFNAATTDNADNGILIDIADTTLDDFYIVNSISSGNIDNGVYFSAENAPINNLRVLGNRFANNGLNGIDFQLLNSSLNNAVIMDNVISGNGNLVAVNPISQFNIEVVFLGGLSASQQAIFQSAANRWAEIIVGDLPDVGLIDDVQITAEGVAIDGVSGILGQAGPTALRTGSDLPYQGLMEFDSADLASLESSGQLEDVILHEMGHVLGIGTIWNRQGLLLNPSGGDGTTDTRFTGALATAQYNSIFGVSDTGVPVENTGGPGTADGHWRESIFDSELMTGFLNTPGPNQLSAITAASLQDQGYIVNLNAADVYVDPTPIQGGGSSNLLVGSFNNNVGPVQYATATMPVSSLVQIDPTATGNGINLSLENSNLNNLLIENNQISGNTGDGIRLLNPQFASNALGDNNITVSLNEINNNIGRGINIALDNGNRLDAIICYNDISNNTLGGINVELEGNSIYRNGIVTGPNQTDETSWFFGNTVNNNDGIGYHIDASDNSQFTLVASRPVASTLNGNEDAGLAVEMSDTTRGTIRLDNLAASSNVDSDNGTATDDANFNGEGFGLIMTDTAILTELRIGDSTTKNTTFNGNFGSGIMVDITDQTRIIDGAGGDGFGTLIQNVTSTNNGAGNAPGVGDGISITRRAESQLDPVWIRSSMLNNNNGDGIDIRAFGGANDFLNPPNTFVQDFLIGGLGASDGNMINDNGVNGIDLLSSGDAVLNVNIFNNTIDTTGTGDGIEGSTEFFGILTGTWQGNTILNAAVDGISISAEDSAGGFGDPAAVMVSIVDNDIDNSGRDGIRINSTTTDQDNDDDVIVAINENVITNSGEDGVTIFADLLGEVRVAEMNDNIINNSGEDGVHIEAIDAGDIRVDTAARNRITNNGGDGVDLFRSGVGELLVGQVDGLGSLIDGDTSGFVDNVVSFNGENGYRIFNSQNGTLTARIAGRTTIDPTLNNGATATSVISNNGSNGIRVENNAGSINQINDLNVQLVRNSVIGNGRDDSIAEDDERNGLLLLAGTSTFGETTADIRQNYLSGNQNIDVVIATFVATPDPASAGFTNQAFSSLTNPDPLARLYLRFEDNRGDQLDVMRDANGDPTVTGYGQAYYDNADSLKSPERFFNPPNSLGTSRRRNATRTTLDLIDYQTGTVLANPAPSATTIATTLPNIGGTGNDYDGGIIGFDDYPTGVRREVTATGVNMGNITLTYNPQFGPVAPGQQFTMSWIDVAGVGESTLVLDDGGGAYDMAQNGAIDGGNFFGSVISDFNDFGAIDPININDAFAIFGDPDNNGFNDITGLYRWRTVNVPTAFDVPPQNPQVPGTPFYNPGADPFPNQPVIFP
ncbi:leishmanolysin-related zinc metalloendopeptidase [Rubinisphaera margarita]|uniref:leishmanolysin-related zinc metalloendopeptidase n=1 Tax=Rubinisphaera margarita TaxID=2909586 RepID=UPI001EE85A3B|nr:leishmanolysin-related zinc metalloendopeptidase [Rubinisphaera margarita]MCG6157795.1 hypothetical protein [Rubinisphaera margarita]